MEHKFPVSEYYREHVVDGFTIKRGGSWWSAILLIKDPKTETPFMCLYRWEQVGEVWKTRKNFKIRDEATLDKIYSAGKELFQNYKRS